MKSGIVWFLAAVCLVFPAVSVHAASGYRIKSAVFLPREFYVGDKVELRVELEVDPGISVSFPDKYPRSSLVKIHDISMAEDGRNIDLRILFTSFAPGTRSLPPVTLGDVVLDSIKIHTSSILNGDSVKFRGIRKPLLVPGTKLLLGIFIGLLFFGPVFVLGFAGTIRKRFHLAMALRRGRRPKKRFLKVLKDLEEKKDRISSRQFYFILSDEYRRYLLLRTDIDFMTTTSTDFGRNIGKIIDDKNFVKSISAMIMFSDSIKFGGVTVNSARKEHDIRIVRQSVDLIEKSIEDKVRRRGKK